MTENTTTARVRFLSGQQLFLLSALFLGHTLMHCFQWGWYIILPAVKASFGLSAVQYGAIDSTRAFAGGLTNFPAAVASDMFRKRWVAILTSGLIGLGLAYFLLGIAPNLAVVFLAAALVGISTAIWHPPALSTLSARVPERVGLALSIHGMGGNLGNAIGPLGLGLAIGALAWQSAAKVLAFPMVVLALVLWAVLRNSPGREGPTVDRKQYLVAIRELLKNKVVLGLVLSQGIQNMGTSSTVAFFSLYCQKDLGFSASKAGLYFAMLTASGIVSQPLMGYLSDRIGRKAVVVPALFLLGGFTSLLVWAGAGVGLLLVAACIGLFIYSKNAVIQAAAMDATDERTGAMTIGLVFASAFLFSTPAPTIAGALSNAYGTPSVFLYSGALMVLSAFIAWLLPMERPRRSAGSQE